MPHADVEQMPFTGERMVPEAAGGQIFREHVERYRLAGQYARGRDVVDVACGEGYGTAALVRAGARSVVGIDVAADAVAHARSKYGVDARQGSAEAIPLADRSVDVVVSFETVEHVPDPAAFVRECARVLRPGGTLVMSTPNAPVYDLDQPSNPYHCSEMDVAAFRSLVGASFDIARMFGQQRPAPWYMRRRGVGRLTKIVRSVVGFRSSAAADRVVAIAATPPGRLDRLLWTEVPVPTDDDRLLSRCGYVVCVATVRADP